jgi:outer membrane protein OmpA-like peptidoglycan-associated protein
MKNLLQKIIFIGLFSAIAISVIANKKFENNIPVTLIKVSGRVLNAQSGSPVKARIIVERLPFSNNIIVSSSDGGTGKYQLNIFNDIQYSIVVQADGYSTYSEIISVNSLEETDSMKDILLTPSIVGQILKMNKLFFKQSTSKISESSYEELNSLYQLLKENPGMIIQLEGHTDFRGNAALNTKLSQDRVEEVKKYLVNKGIKKQRVKVKAFGGSMPLTTENTEEAQQMNRRVEVRILGK